MPYVDSGGLRLFYTESGDGLPVLWHTGGCGDSTMWEQAGYIAALPGYRHILFDHRGHGRSQSPPDMAGHHMRCYVEDVVAVLDDAGVERAVMVGYSQGAQIGYALAAAHPGRLAGLVALDSVPDAEEDPAGLRADADKVMADGTRAVIEKMAASESQPPPAWLLDHLCATDAATFAGAYETFATAAPFWPDATRMAVPTLFLLGVGDDEQDWWALGQRAANTVPDGLAVALHGMGHLQAFWRTDLSLPPIERFLARFSPSSGA
ncbi:MAG TPA: alpha/beta hydrolase [Streptosporangiaceae bacterium]|nr:alpha/beta hydrolase [Streptosporangiaceae bacterium]